MIFFFCINNQSRKTRRYFGNSIAIKYSPTGIIQNPKIGRNPKIPPTINSNPAIERNPGRNFFTAQKLAMRRVRSMKIFHAGTGWWLGKFIQIVFVGKPPALQLRIHLSPVEEYLKRAAPRFDQFDVRVVFFRQNFPHTEGSRLIISLHAIFDSELHSGAPLQNFIDLSDFQKIPRLVYQLGWP